jgi:hypothetical protein
MRGYNCEERYLGNVAVGYLVEPREQLLAAERTRAYAHKRGTVEEVGGGGGEGAITARAYKL